jgi:hypothetical protein
VREEKRNKMNAGRSYEGMGLEIIVFFNIQPGCQGASSLVSLDSSRDKLAVKIWELSIYRCHVKIKAL